MQTVSQAYAESMKSALRERAYIMITFGLVNQEIQMKSTVNDGDYTYFSNKDDVLTKHSDDIVYATLEENFTKVDGSMYFLPRKREGIEYHNTGIVSNKLVSDAICEVVISLNTLPTDFKGMTIRFGDNYPVNFDIVGSNGQVIEIRDNTESEWFTDKVVEETTYVKLKFYKMKNPRTRLRIYSITFGYGLIYYNDSVLDSTLETYVSPISADVPQIDFSVQLKNYDRYFNVDNPTSAINYFETGQQMEVRYGYQTPGADEIEWIQGATLQCSEWESDDTTATIRCYDAFRNMDAEYYKGMYTSKGKSYYSLAEDVLTDIGVTKYDIDESLKNMYSTNPVPKVSHKEALQIIANACRCVLTQSRDGVIQIKSDLQTKKVNDFTINRRDMTSYPKVIKQERVKEIVVPCTVYQEDPVESSLVSDTVTVKSNEIETYFVSDPSYGYRILLNDSEGGADIVEWGNYYITVRFKTTGTYKLEILGHQYKTVEKQAVKSLHGRGKTVTWRNPLISDMNMASSLAEWLSDYYLAGVEYEYNTRGNPELDANDIVYQENEFRDNMKVDVYRNTLKFKQAFSGSITARRVGD